MKKRLGGVLLVFLLVLSIFTLAEETPAQVVEVKDCGIWCTISQFLWGNPDNWVGQSWFDRDLVGE